MPDKRQALLHAESDGFKKGKEKSSTVIANLPYLCEKTVASHPPEKAEKDPITMMMTQLIRMYSTPLWGKVRWKYIVM